MPLWEGQAPVAEDNPTRGPDDPRYDEVVRIVPRSEDETRALASPLVILLAAIYFRKTIAYGWRGTRSGGYMPTHVAYGRVMR